MLINFLLCTDCDLHPKAPALEAALVVTDSDTGTAGQVEVVETKPFRYADLIDVCIALSKEPLFNNLKACYKTPDSRNGVIDQYWLCKEFWNDLATEEEQFQRLKQCLFYSLDLIQMIKRRQAFPFGKINYQAIHTIVEYFKFKIGTINLGAYGNFSVHSKTEASFLAYLNSI